MKKTLLLTVLSMAAIGASAQQIIEQPTIGQNWSIGLNGGVITPLVNHPFFGSMRGVYGATISKQLTPIVGLGIEGLGTTNTSSWVGPKSSTMIDASYVGAYGTVDLMNLFCGYNCQQRSFDIDALAGIGWGHKYWQKSVRPDKNFIATKAGFNFNFNVSPEFTITLQPSIMWNMTESDSGQSAPAYNAKRATFNFQVGATYHIGGDQFNCVVPMDPALIEALNTQINVLRAQADEATIAANAWHQKAHSLADQLEACQSQPTVVEQAEVVTEVNNYLNTVRYVFFKIGSSAITPDQMPNVEMIASYLKNHPDATVAIKGYASKDGPQELNIKLAKARAESVKNALVSKYGVKASRITADGEGIGNMFDEESWNRVSICTINNPQ